MRLIDRIKDDLKKISPWPWEALSDNETTISSVTGELLTVTDTEFALLSPERIAALVEFYEAHQDLITFRLLRAVFRKEGKSRKGIEKLRKAHNRFQKARAELEKEMLG